MFSTDEGEECLRSLIQSVEQCEKRVVGQDVVFPSSVTSDINVLKNL